MKDLIKKTGGRCGNSHKRMKDYLILYAVFLLLSLYMVSKKDDLIYQLAIERYGSLGKWAKWFSQNWGGRIIPSSFLVFLLRQPPIVFHFFDALAWVLLIVYVKKVFDIDGKIPARFLYGLVPALIFVLIPEEVLSETVFWKCANVIYLWGGATLLIAIYPVVKNFYKKEIRTSEYMAAVPAVIYTAGFEQAGALMCGVMLMLLLFTRLMNRSVNREIIVLTVLALVSTLCFCSLPGNTVRLEAEILCWFPTFDIYTLPDKAMLGIWYIISGIETDAVYIVLLLAATVVLLMRRNRRAKDPVLIGAYIMLGYFVLCTINRIGLANGGTEYFLSDIFRLVTVDSLDFGFDLSLAVRSIIHFMVYVYLGCCILMIDPEKPEIPGFIFYFGGLATMWIMGFIPTIYASGRRPAFLCYLMLLCVEVKLITLSPLISLMDNKDCM